MDEDIEEYLSAGADVVLSKPLKKATVDMLLALISAEGPLSRGPAHRLVANGGVLEWVEVRRNCI